MKFFIVYVCKDQFINELCLQCENQSMLNIFVPQIGETFVDKKRNVEYEVEDIVRSINSQNVYGIQVMLKHRQDRKYK